MTKPLSLHNLLATLLTMAALLAGQTAQATVPQSIVFEGRVVNGSFSFKIGEPTPMFTISQQGTSVTFNNQEVVSQPILQLSINGTLSFTEANEYTNVTTDGTVTLTFHSPTNTSNPHPSWYYGATVKNKAGNIQGSSCSISDNNRTITVTIPNGTSFYYVELEQVTNAPMTDDNTTVTVPAGDYWVSNSNHKPKPEPTVVYGQTTLVKDIDYTLSWSNNGSAGIGTVTVNGIGNYAGSATGTFSIRWARYYVHFDKNHNNATGTMANQAFTYATSQHLTANAFTYNGYTFYRWYTNPDGTGTSYTNGQLVNNLTVIDGETVTLYAQWASNYWPQGIGTPSDPYIITTPAGLQQLSTEVNGGNDFDGKYFKLGNNIDMSDVENFVPIGIGINPVHPFKGTFDGNNDTISHLNVYRDGESHVGLFGHLSGRVQNVVIANSTIWGSVSIGGIAGYCAGGESYSKISNCCVVNSTITCSSKFVGGIVGCCAGEYSYCDISDCRVINSTITGSNQYVGGIAGRTNDCTVTYCHVINSTITNSNQYVGGIVGSTQNCTVTDCHVINSTITNSNEYVGGIVGSTNDCTVTNCHVVSSTITAFHNSHYVGAIVGNKNYDTYSYSGNTYHSTLIIDGFCSCAFNIGYGVWNSFPNDDSGAKLNNNILFVDAGRPDLDTLLSAYADPSHHTRGNSPPPNLDGLIAEIRGDVTVPSGCVLKAQTVTITGSNSLTLADGAQLVCNNPVFATVQKVINAHGATTAEGGWYFIALPTSSPSLSATSVAGLITDNLGNTATPETATYDLYKFDQNPSNGLEWKNYRNNSFNIERGQGYLYASKAGTTLNFKGNIRPCTPNVSVNLAYTEDAELAGWNLVGNPYTFFAYLNKPYYKMNENGSAILATEQSSDTIAPCTGVMVKATGNDQSVTFSMQPFVTSPSNGNVSIAVVQANERGASTTTIDRAIVSFNKGSELPKFYFGNANLYIPQGGKDFAIVSSEGQGEMPLNFKAEEDGTYTIMVNPENVDLAYLHLIDNMTGADVDLLTPAYGHPLTEGDLPLCKGGRGDSQPASYTFTAKTTDYESRFKLVFSICGDANGDNEAPFAFVSNGNIIITADADDAMLQVVDLMGRVVVSVGGHTRCVPTVGMPTGVYVLRLIQGNDVKTQKIVIE